MSRRMPSPRRRWKDVSAIARRALLLAGLLLAGHLIAAVASAQSFRFVAPGAGAVLRVGEPVEVRWSGLPSSAEEMEVLLSLDDGRHFPVRLTAELATSRDALQWWVPALPGHAARLAMRARIDGREVLIGESASFVIRMGSAARAAALRVPVVRRDGEIWAEEAAVEPGRPEPEGWASPPPPPALSGAAAAPAAPAPRTSAALSKPRGPVLDERLTPASLAPAGASLPTDRRPLVAPLRN